jgi:hypothetical protein
MFFSNFLLRFLLRFFFFGLISFRFSLTRFYDFVFFLQILKEYLDFKISLYFKICSIIKCLSFEIYLDLKIDLKIDLKNIQIIKFV